MPSASATSAENELRRRLGQFRSAFVAVGALSGVLNVLMLTGSFFMLLVYDEVIPGRSLPTLAGLLAMAAVLYAFQGGLDHLRAQIAGHVAAALDIGLGPRLHDVVLRARLRGMAQGDGLQPVRDLDQIRGFLSGPAASAFFDLPWVFVYLTVCFLFHSLIGVTVVLGVALLVALALRTEVMTRAPIVLAAQQISRRNGLLETGRRNVETAHAMGMTGRLEAIWRDANRTYVESQQRAAQVTGAFGVATRALRMLFQSVVLAIGALLVVQGKATGGIVIASSILSARALAPIEQAVANWRGFGATRQAWRRLAALMDELPPVTAPAPLPPPRATLAVERLTVVPPGSRRASALEVSFALKAGDAVGVIGPSASGKSSLARALVGVWPAYQGSVRLDGASLDQWAPERLGPHVGYLPQEVELIDGSIAQNIARLDPEASMEAIVAAAQAAGVHELVLRLPGGYDAPVGPGGAALSAGQRQRIALARAMFGEPFLLVLDEPNSNLDAEGESALGQAIANLRRRGAIVIVVAHRPSAMGAVNLALCMAEGRVQAFGPKDEVLAQVLRPAAQPVRLQRERAASG